MLSRMKVCVLAQNDAEGLFGVAYLRTGCSYEWAHNTSIVFGAEWPNSISEWNRRCWNRSTKTQCWKVLQCNHKLIQPEKYVVFACIF